MRRVKHLLFLCLFCLCMSIPSALAQGQTHALLVACSDFVTQPDLGAAISGNLHMVGSALISSDVPLGSLSIEDGTIGTVESFYAAVSDAFSVSDEEDLSILYLCTHGLLSSSDDGQIYLLLGDGENESALSARQLYESLAPIQGEKLLILDACHSGALIGRGHPDAVSQPGEFLSPFLSDSSIHVLTSSSGEESSWYYDSESLATGAVSYFASALASGLGLYGTAEADLNGDGSVTLEELHRHLSAAVPSSSCQILSRRAGTLLLPTSSLAMLSRPLSGFAYGSSLLSAGDPTLEFSFTVAKPNTTVQYRLIDYTDGSWDWQNAKTFLDGGDQDDGVLSPGRKNRMLSLDGLTPGEGGYMMLQIFSITDGALLLCSERLIAVQSMEGHPALSLSCPESFTGIGALPIAVQLDEPAELTAAVCDVQGLPIRRLVSGMMTRPSGSSITHLYWDGKNDEGLPVPPGQYTIVCETRINGRRLKASAHVTVALP